MPQTQLAEPVLVAAGLYDRLFARASAFGAIAAPVALAFDPDSEVLSPLKDGRYEDMLKLATEALKRGRYGGRPHIRLFVVDPARGDMVEAQSDLDGERFVSCERDDSWIPLGARSRPSSLSAGEA